jgi:hypothetical protein
MAIKILGAGKRTNEVREAGGDLKVIMFDTL